jgi:hypothetical protein
MQLQRDLPSHSAGGAQAFAAQGGATGKSIDLRIDLLDISEPALPSAARHTPTPHAIGDSQ